MSTIFYYLDCPPGHEKDPCPLHPVMRAGTCNKRGKIATCKKKIRFFIFLQELHVNFAAYTGGLFSGRGQFINQFIILKL